VLCIYIHIISLSFRTPKKHANGEKDGGEEEVEEMNPTFFVPVAASKLYSGHDQ